MPFRQSLRSAFLRFPCGHGGSQFTPRGEEPGLIPPARVCPQQAEPSGVETPLPLHPPAIARIRRTPGVHKDTLNFLGAGSRKTKDGADHSTDRRGIGDRNDGDNDDEASGRAKHAGGMRAIGPDDDPPSSLREPGHYDNIGNPMLDPDLRQHSLVSESSKSVVLMQANSLLRHSWEIHTACLPLRTAQPTTRATVCNNLSRSKQ